ncbi:hypothetical protein DXT76_19020 [Halobacillus trueperi]|uniref:Uncharacterized protein n=1 Tax=Halobacillus trueperi TaxID=156205 RepID=A0A3D8VE23_9BACI|nr:hypothetical protein DXT76_19020 [Halobacillus trueperi]
MKEKRITLSKHLLLSGKMPVECKQFLEKTASSPLLLFSTFSTVEEEESSFPTVHPHPSKEFHPI